MSELVGLWIPIVASAIAVVSVRLGVQLAGLRSCEVKDLPEEEATVEQLQKSGIGPGMYQFPSGRRKLAPDREELRMQRINSGPWGTINIRAQPPSIGRQILQTLLFCLVTSLVVAYLSTLALSSGARFLQVFQVTGTAGILAYAFGGVQNTIWFGTNLRGALLDAIEGICFGLMTGVVFGLLWPR